MIVSGVAYICGFIASMNCLKKKCACTVLACVELPRYLTLFKLHNFTFYISEGHLKREGHVGIHVYSVATRPL